MGSGKWEPDVLSVNAMSIAHPDDYYLTKHSESRKQVTDDGNSGAPTT